MSESNGVDFWKIFILLKVFFCLFLFIVLVLELGFHCYFILVLLLRNTGIPGYFNSKSIEIKGIVYLKAAFFKSNHQRCPIKKLPLKISPVLEFLFNKNAGLKPATLLKRDSNTGVFL